MKPGLWGSAGTNEREDGVRHSPPVNCDGWRILFRGYRGWARRPFLPTSQQKEKSENPCRISHFSFDYTYVNPNRGATCNMLS